MSGIFGSSAIAFLLQCESLSEVSTLDSMQVFLVLNLICSEGKFASILKLHSFVHMGAPNINLFS